MTKIVERKNIIKVAMAKPLISDIAGRDSERINFGFWEKSAEPRFLYIHAYMIRRIQRENLNHFKGQNASALSPGVIQAQAV